MTKHRVLAFLQNQWFRDPARAAGLLTRYQKHEGGVREGRERFIRDMLFFGCLTGKRLEQAFGEELCGYGGIVWEEASSGLHGKASSSPPADPPHILDVLLYHDPTVVICFGAVAKNGLLAAEKRMENTNAIWEPEYALLQAPHPAARDPETMTKLKQTAKRLREILES